MNFINGITILLLYQLLGEAIVLALQIATPGPVLGMLLLFMTLVVRKQAGTALESASSALLTHLSLLFVPAGVGMMVHFSRIADEWLPIGVTLILSTVITMAATAGIMLCCSRLVTSRAESSTQAPKDPSDD